MILQAYAVLPVFETRYEGWSGNGRSARAAVPPRSRPWPLAWYRMISVLLSLRLKVSDGMCLCAHEGQLCDTGTPLGI